MTESSDLRLITESAAAELLCVSVRTLQSWRLRSQGPPYVKAGRAIRYSLADLSAWIRSVRTTQTPTAEAKACP